MEPARRELEVLVTSEVFRSCLYHAYLTQQEEVAGLLLGDKQVQPNGSVLIRCISSITNQRKIKEKDRVEIDPEQLSDAMVQAEQLSRDTGRLFDVVGWYHSHPNITVFPSQVDINTQLSMQMIGSDFIGIIFSVFVGSTKVSGSSAIGKTELIAFQSYEDYADGQKKARTLRVKIVESDKLLR